MTDDCDNGYIPPYLVDEEQLTSAAGNDELTSENTDGGGNVTPEPSDPEVPIYTFDQLTSICNSVGLTPNVLDGIFAQLLVGHFYTADNIIYPGVKDLVWSPDSEESKLFIYSGNQWLDGATQGKQPAIVYGRGPQRTQRMAIGDQNGDVQTVQGGFHAARHTKAMQGNHNIVCIGHNEFQSTELGTEVATFLEMFAHRLVRTTPFLDFQVGEVGKPQSLSDLADKLAVAIPVTYRYIWAWQVSSSSPTLKATTI